MGRGLQRCEHNSYAVEFESVYIIVMYSELRSYVKAEVAVLANRPYGLCGRKATFEKVVCFTFKSRQGQKLSKGRIATHTKS